MSRRPSNKPNYFYAIFSVTIVLTLLGLFGLLAMQGQYFVKAFKEKIEIIVEVKDETTFDGIDSIKQFIAKKTFCKANSIRFISKEEGAKMMQKEFGEEFLKLDLPNPLYDVVLFNLKSDYLDKDSLTQVRAYILEQGNVSDVYYQEDVTKVIADNLDKISFAVLAGGLFFIVVAIVLILNTIRLSLYANRFIIKNMELVGASWDFISKPYLVRSLWHGLLSAFLACGFLALMIFLLIEKLPEIGNIFHLPAVGLLFGILLIMGIMISVLSTYFVVRKYLKMRVDDLY